MADRGKSGGRGNPKNLIPFDRRTEIEQRKIATMGGKASGKARRQKADFRRVLNQILTMPVPDEVTREQLEALGLDGDMQTLLNSTMLKKALSGNVKAAEFVARYAAQSEKTELDDRQQNAEIRLKEQEAELRAARAELEVEKLKAEIERLRAGKGTDADDDMVLQFIDGMRGDSDD